MGSSSTPNGGASVSGTPRPAEASREGFWQWASFGWWALCDDGVECLAVGCA